MLPKPSPWDVKNPDMIPEVRAHKVNSPKSTFKGTKKK